jgi:predicted neutral ceramidase superfamily lipid hydrolase
MEVHMKYRFIPACVMLTAGLVCCLLSIVQQWPVMRSLVTLIIVLLLFYIIGQIAAQIVGKVQADHQAMIEAEKKRLEEEERLRMEEAEREMQEQGMGGDAAGEELI